MLNYNVKGGNVSHPIGGIHISENISPDRYVNLDKEIVMKCVYNNKFKKWEPIVEIGDDKITKIKDIKYVENKV